jgi:hypothetical protein
MTMLAISVPNIGDTHNMIKLIASLVATLVTLLVLWCAAGTASAAECTRRPMVQGTIGESVLTCDGTLPAFSEVRPTVRAHRTVSAARRAGTTTVVHYGHRAPTYTITYLASH